jgi:hypothetical protein
MQDNIGSLWPNQIRPRILSPIQILRAQAEGLAKQTAGLLFAEVNADEDEEDTTVSFEIVVPALKGYRHRIMNVKYKNNLPYPAIIDAEIFRGTQNDLRSFLATVKGESKAVNRANDDQEFFEIVRMVLNSPPVISAAQSLIARANEALEETEYGSPEAPDLETPDLLENDKPTQ